MATYQGKTCDRCKCECTDDSIDFLVYDEESRDPVDGHLNEHYEAKNLCRKCTVALLSIIFKKNGFKHDLKIVFNKFIQTGLERK